MTFILFMLSRFLFELEIAAKENCSMFSSPKPRRRDQIVNFQVATFEGLDKSMTGKNKDMTETGKVFPELKMPEV